MYRRRWQADDDVSPDRRVVPVSGGVLLQMPLYKQGDLTDTASRFLYIPAESAAVMPPSADAQ